jgi:hypothetical protein
VAVEQHPRARPQEPQQRHAGADLVDEEDRGAQPRELVGEDGDLQDQVQLTQDGAEDGEAAKDCRRDERVAADAHVKGSWSSRNFSQALASTERVGAYRRGPRGSSGTGRSAT